MEPRDYKLSRDSEWVAVLFAIIFAGMSAITLFETVSSGSPSKARLILGIRFFASLAGLSVWYAPKIPQMGVRLCEEGLLSLDPTSSRPLLLGRKSGNRTCEIRMTLATGQDYRAVTVDSQSSGGPRARFLSI